MVEKFVERAVTNGVDVFRIFDAMNGPRNLTTTMAAVKKYGAHAQGTLSYTTSPVHTKQSWLDLARTIEDMGVDSLAIKDMAGILTPYNAFDFVKELKSSLSIPIALHAHATAGLSSMTILKAVEAGIDHVDTSISSISMTYGHSPTESIVAALAGRSRDPKLDLVLLKEIATYFREVRKKYANFEATLRGVDSRILIAQVPGGMLTNMEAQLKEQGASDKFDGVLKEILQARADLGFIPLVTPTSQIVGTQAVLNVLTGVRYKSISKETQVILKGEYGKAPSAFNADLQAQVLEGTDAINCRPADLLPAELDSLTTELKAIANTKDFTLAEDEIDDVLTYALFPQIGLKYFENRHNPDAFEPTPQTTELSKAVATDNSDDKRNYSVSVNGRKYTATVGVDGKVDVHINGINYITTVTEGIGDMTSSETTAALHEVIAGPLAGNIFKINVAIGQQVDLGDILIIYKQ